MVITKTPYRISFFGGGTDYPQWSQSYGGAILGTTIDKYSYQICRFLPPFFDHKHRVVYSKTELVNDVSEIQHPSVRETIKFLGIQDGIEIHYHGDLPARSGMATSSAFTVGLLNGLSALKGLRKNSKELAEESIYIEQRLIQESVGSQDQTLVSYGGLNFVEFEKTGKINVSPLKVDKVRKNEFLSCLSLFYTGKSRLSEINASRIVEDISQKKEALFEIKSIAHEASSLLSSMKSYPSKELGYLFNRSWELKKLLACGITNPSIDDAYSVALKAGAMGGKILGAGGGGFLLIYSDPDLKPRIIEALKGLLHLPFSFEEAGAQILFQSEDEGEREVFLEQSQTEEVCLKTLI